MGIAGLDWQTMQIPFAAGLDTKADARAGDPPGLDVCRDVQFDEVGGLQTRLPFTALGSSILGGGSIANARRLVANGDELVLFTDTQLFSWSAQASAWVPRATHLAVAVDETPRCATPGDQIDGDRAELNGLIVVAWVEATTVFAAAVDKTTGAMIVAPTALSTAVGRPRVVALATRILLFVDAGASNLTVRAINPASPAAGIAGAGTTVAAGTFNTFYDVVKVEGQDICAGAHVLSPSSSYRVFTVTAGLVVTGATKARACNSPIAVASTPGSGTQLQIVRPDLTNVLGDLLTTSTLADVFVNQALGTASSTNINQVTVAYSTATTAVAFWTSDESPTFSSFAVKSNTVTTANVVGSQATLRLRLGIASRAFGYAGRAYIWLAFAGESGTSAQGNTSAVRAQLQNTYFLYRDDGLLVSRAADDVAGGFAPTTGRLPGVQLVSGTTSFAWCGTVRRVVELGATAEHSGFGARSLRDVVFTFDDDRARRTARLGRTLYVSGGIPLQYDGLALVEVGFLIYPWYFEPQVGAAGNLAAGTYTWKATNRWTNAQGEVDRSTTATGMGLSVPASKFVFLNWMHLHVTLKGAPRPPALDMWRTVAGAGFDSPFYLVTSQDPNAGIVDNGYAINNDTVTFPTPMPDNFADATLTTKEESPENGATLEYLAPPGAQIIVATDTRVFLGAVSGDPDAVWYSRERGSNEVASFHDQLRIDVPTSQVGTGPVTAVALNNETLTVFRLTAIYAFPGGGFDNNGGGSNYGPARIVSLDVGAVSQEAVALTPVGTVFKSRKGWYLLGPDWGLKYIGAKVSAFDSDTITAIDVVETQHQVRILSSGRMLVWDYDVNEWSEWTITDGVDATMWRGSHVYLTATGPKVQQTTFTGVTYGWDVETSWIKPQQLQGFARVREVALLGEFRSACLIRTRVAYNYDPTFIDDKPWTPAPGVVGGPLQVRHTPERPQCEAIKLRLSAVAAGVAATVVTNVALSIGTLTTDWAATLRAVAPGAAGNGYAIAISVIDGAPFAISVRDHFRFVSGRWVEAPNTIGVLVTCRTGSSPTVAQLEVAILANTHIATFTATDPSPSKVLNAAALAGALQLASFTGGTYVAPSGEAAKLTGLALEVGIKRGIYKRLAAAQKE